MPERDIGEMSAKECIQELIYMGLGKDDFRKIMDDIHASDVPGDFKETARRTSSVLARYEMAEIHPDGDAVKLNRKGHLFVKAMLDAQDELQLGKVIDGTHRVH